MRAKYPMNKTVVPTMSDKNKPTATNAPFPSKIELIIIPIIVNRVTTYVAPMIVVEKRRAPCT